MKRILPRMVFTVFRPEMFCLLAGIRDRVYTAWIANRFGSFGRGCIVKYPIMLQGGEYIHLSEGAGIGQRSWICAWDSYRNGSSYSPQIRIGSRSWIGEMCHISAADHIVIGNGVLIGKMVTIVDNSHGSTSDPLCAIMPIDRPLMTKGPIEIGDNVWIGEKATILPGIRIGSNSIVGANSVITKDVPENSVVAGCPGRVIRRFVGENCRNVKLGDSE